MTGAQQAMNEDFAAKHDQEKTTLTLQSEIKEITQTLRMEMRAEAHALRMDIRRLGIRLAWKLGIMLSVGFGSFFALLQLFPPE